MGAYVVDERYRHNRAIVATSNLDPDRLATVLNQAVGSEHQQGDGARVVDRLCEMCLIVRTGPTAIVRRRPGGVCVRLISEADRQGRPSQIVHRHHCKPARGDLLLVDMVRKRRLEELRRLFIVTEVSGKTPACDVAAETIALYLNRKYGRQIVVRRDRKATSL